MNLTLLQNTVNTIKPTLSESISLTGANIYFLFRFISQTTNEEVLFTAPNISLNPLRYDHFNITLTGSTYTNLTGGTISLSPNGSYKYQVYEMENQYNLALSGTSGRILEQGLVQVSGYTTPFITNYYSGQSTTYKYYEQQ